MGEILVMFLTGGGSTAMGAILKGVFGMVLKLGSKSMTLSLREKVVRMIISLDFKSASLKVVLQNLLIVCVSCLHALVLVLCVFQLSCVRSFPAELIVLSNATGEGRTEILFGLLSWQSPQEPIQITSGHISLMGNLTILPCILGFYFWIPSPRR